MYIIFLWIGQYLIGEESGHGTQVRIGEESGGMGHGTQVRGTRDMEGPVAAPLALVQGPALPPYTCVCVCTRART